MDIRRFNIQFGQSANPSIDYLLGIIYDARAVTLNYIKDISTEELQWQYKPDWNSVSALLIHIYSCEEYFRIWGVEDRPLLKAEQLQLFPGLELGEHLPDLISDKPLRYYVSQLESSRARLLQSLKGLPMEDFTRNRKGYDQQTGCNLAWILYHMAEDEVHHRGQISIIRKLYKAQHS